MTKKSTFCRFIIALALLVGAIGTQAQTTLTAGDIAFTGINTTDPDQFSFVLLHDVTANTVIRFTDNGWLSTGAFRGNEGVITWTATAALTCGNQVTILATSASTFSATSGTVAVATSGFLLSTSGDQIFAYQGTDVAPVFIAGINTDGAWAANATTANNSALPSALTNGTNAIAVGSGVVKNALYNCAVLNGGKAILDTAVNNSAHWTTSTTVVTLPPTCNFSCSTQPADCAGVPGGTAFYDNCNICAGGTTGITPNLDSDGDGVLDCNDGCPNDPNKVAPGICGCGKKDTSLAFAGNDTVVCLGQPLTLTATGTASGTYQWSNGANTATDPISQTVGSYTYAVTVTNGAGCVTHDSVTVTVNALPLANAGADISLCPGGNASFTATGGGSYLWSTGSSSSTIQYVGAATDTSFSVTVTDANNCAAADTVHVTASRPPLANAGPDQSICRGNSTTLAASGGVSFVWSTGDHTSSIVVSPTNDTQYVVTVTDNNCSATDTVFVTVNTPPVVNLGPDRTICQGDSATLTSNSVGSFSWNNGDTTRSIVVHPTTNTTYNLKVTDVNLCATTDTINITVNQAPVVNLGLNQSICLGDSSTVQAPAGYTYLWSTGDITQTIVKHPTTSATYSVTVTDGNGCKGSDGVNVTVNLPSITTSADTSICAGTSATVVGTGGQLYNWSNGATTASITVSPQNNTTYVLTILDPNGCIWKDSTVVSVNPSPTVASSANHAVCAGDSATITVVGAQTYTWSTGATTASIAVTPTQTTTYVVTGINANGCAGRDSTVITVNQLPSTSITGLNTQYCDSAADVVLVGSPTGGTFLVDGSASSTFNPSAVGDGSHAVTYVYVDNNLCAGTTKDTVTVSHCTGIARISNDVAVNVYPNPFNGQLILEIGQTGQALNLQLFDMMGRVMLAREVAGGTTTVSVPTSLPAGLYLLEVKGNGVFNTFRLVHGE